jgi:hypothetical protein
MSQVVMIDSTEVLQALLDLADNPRDVQTTTDYGTLAVVVPDDLYERYQKYQNLSESSPPEEPKKRGPGRPRKYQLPGLE